MMILKFDTLSFYIPLPLNLVYQSTDIQNMDIYALYVQLIYLNNIASIYHPKLIISKFKKYNILIGIYFYIWFTIDII